MSSCPVTSCRAAETHPLLATAICIYCHRITDSVRHQVFKSKFPAQAVSPKTYYSGLCPDIFSTSPGSRNSQPLWAGYSSAQSLSQQSSSYSAVTSCVPVSAHCLMSYLLSRPRRAWLCSVDTLPCTHWYNKIRTNHINKPAKETPIAAKISLFQIQLWEKSCY